MGYFGLQFLMSNGTLWKVVGNQALPRPADPNGIVPVTLTGCPNCGMIATPGNEFILTLSGNGTAYYDSTADAYVSTRLPVQTLTEHGLIRECRRPTRSWLREGRTDWTKPRLQKRCGPRPTSGSTVN
jgi:hypothetical protein